MKIVTKNYYQSIKEIEYSPAECVKKVYPIHKAGEKEKILGIPVHIYKENVYDADDVRSYANLPYFSKYVKASEICPIIGYTVEIFDTFISVCRLAYIKVDGEFTYFTNNETYEKYLSVIKGRCSELGNSIYKNIILSDKLINY